MPADYYVSVYEDPAEFTAAAEPFLLEREAEHCLQLGLLGNLRAGFAPDAYLAVVRAPGGAPVLVALHTPPHRLIVSQVAAGHAVDEVVAPLVPAAPVAPGVVGARGPSAAFARTWSAAHAQSARRVQAERIYVCTGVLPPAAVPGRMAPATLEHRELLIAWRLAFQAEAAPSDPRRTLAAAAEMVERDLAVADGGLWFWVVDGEPVCLAGARGVTRNGIRIGPVYTPPAQRKQGYASALTAALTQHLLTSGRAHVTLFTNLANPTSNAIYQAIGYRPVIDQDVYDFA